MGVVHKQYLDEPIVIACRHCSTHFTTPRHLLSKAFQGATGRAYLYDYVCNGDEGPEQTRQMTTGVHVVCDVKCVDCAAVIGWKYVRAWEDGERYKEGKWCVERALVVELHHDRSP